MDCVVYFKSPVSSLFISPGINDIAEIDQLQNGCSFKQGLIFIKITIEQTLLNENTMQILLKAQTSINQLLETA